MILHLVAKMGKLITDPTIIHSIHSSEDSAIKEADYIGSGLVFRIVADTIPASKLKFYNKSKGKK